VYEVTSAIQKKYSEISYVLEDNEEDEVKPEPKKEAKSKSSSGSYSDENSDSLNADDKELIQGADGAE